MKFSRTLSKSVYEPWKDHYLDYGKLKELLREDADESQSQWTEADEAKFVEELLNVQLDKVNTFQGEMYKKLGEQMNDCERELERFAPQAAEDSGSGQQAKEAALKGTLEKLDQISRELSELEKFSRLNFTGALKAAKKHDRRRGTNYRIRPILQVRLASLPFNSEDYSPLLYRLSAMYAFARQEANEPARRTTSHSETRSDQTAFTTYKFFVHPDNLLEVKTYILRHLPVLVYTPHTTKVADGTQEDPTITSLYFDDPKFGLYNNKIEKGKGASSLRVRWFGPLDERPELILEKKTMLENEDSRETRFAIKNKYVMPFIKGEYKMQKSAQKLRDRKGADSQAARELEADADDIQRFIVDNSLQPLVRANYTRTAFQIPGENRVRISIDTNIAFIREDALDTERPCRDPEKWHRSEIDDTKMQYPFDAIKKGEISRFPYSVLEIKMRADIGKRRLEWIEELMSSHLVKEAPRFSKFVHGVASLFEDYVNIFPFWTSLLETDIRKNPDDAFREEQEKKAKQAEDEFAVGSLIGSAPKPSFKEAASSPVANFAALAAAENRAGSSRQVSGAGKGATAASNRENEEEEDLPVPDSEEPTGLKSYLPTLSTSKYARAKRMQPALPPGVKKPSFWIKDTGPVKVEPKVWLANQRTFLKWEHIAVLLATLALGLYNSAGPNDTVARTLGIVYTSIAVFAAVWGWAMFMNRSSMIENRSGRDFDNVVGPIVVSIALAVALCLNFGFQYRSFLEKQGALDWAVRNSSEEHIELKAR